MIQLIASDMDGTLLDADKKLPSQFPALLEELYRRDITLAIASGRSRTALLSLFGDLAEELIFICDNGACVMQPHDAPIFHNLPDQTIRDVLDLCDTMPDTIPVLCGFHHIYFPENADQAVENEIRRFYLDYHKVPYSALYQTKEPILKIALCNMHGTAAYTAPMIQERFGSQYEIPVSGDYWMDLMCKGITKGAAVQDLQKQLGITPAETMTFGDYENDISMMECAEYSYAMANAPEHVQKHAKHIAPANTENGVVRTICEVLGIHMDSLRKSV